MYGTSALWVFQVCYSFIVFLATMIQSLHELVKHYKPETLLQYADGSFHTAPCAGVCCIVISFSLRCGVQEGGH